MSNGRSVDVAEILGSVLPDRVGCTGTDDFGGLLCSGMESNH